MSAWLAGTYFRIDETLRGGPDDEASLECLDRLYDLGTMVGAFIGEYPSDEPPVDDAHHRPPLEPPPELLPSLQELYRRFMVREDELYEDLVRRGVLEPPSPGSRR